MPHEIMSIKLYSVKEAEEILGMPAKTVRRYLQEGVLIGFQIERRWFISEASIKAFKAIEAERQKAREEILRVRDVFDDFLKKGDINRRYYDGVMARLNEFVV